MAKRTNINHTLKLQNYSCAFEGKNYDVFVGDYNNTFKCTEAWLHTGDRVPKFFAHLTNGNNLTIKTEF